MDSTNPNALAQGFEYFRREWESKFGRTFLLPHFSQDTVSQFRVVSRGVTLDDVVIADVHGFTRTEGTPQGIENQVRMYVIRRGTYALRSAIDGKEYAVSSGRFYLQHFGSPPRFETAPLTTVKIVLLPAPLFRPLLQKKTIIGSMGTAEMRILLAHSEMIRANIADLGPFGAQAAKSTLTELARAVVLGRLDDTEPRFAPALAEAAKSIATRLLNDSGLSGAMLARELNVSVRTLQRSFASSGDSISSYIRNQRLEGARLELTKPCAQLSISEIAARWQFADSSHFIRAFRKRYGQTPTEYARSHNASTGQRSEIRLGG